MDLGTVVNPDGVKAQIEGSTLWGMSLALFEKAPLKNGALQVSNFDSYTPMRMSQMPDLDIAIIANNEPAVGLRRARASRWWRPPSPTRYSTRWGRGCARCRSRRKP